MRKDDVDYEKPSLSSFKPLEAAGCMVGSKGVCADLSFGPVSPSFHSMNIYWILSLGQTQYKMLRTQCIWDWPEDNDLLLVAAFSFVFSETFFSCCQTGICYIPYAMLYAPDCAKHFAQLPHHPHNSSIVYTSPFYRWANWLKKASDLSKATLS